MNRTTYNNGLSNQKNPWLCSDMYAWLNSKSMDIPNAETADPETVEVDYTSTGVYDKLPDTLRNVIAERPARSPIRYIKGELLTEDNSRQIDSIGKLWIPNETEVCGQVAYGSQKGSSVSDSHQYPIFTDGKTRIKRIGNTNTRGHWWLRSTGGGGAGWTAISDAGYTTSTSVKSYAIICFRVSE